MRREPRSPSAQEKRGAARDVDHAAVEAGLQQFLAIDPVVERCRIDPVFTDQGVDQHHGDGRAPLPRVHDDAAVVTRQVFADPVTQGVVIADRHRSTIGTLPARWAIAVNLA
jgi:hypothetical protein